MSRRGSSPSLLQPSPQCAPSCTPPSHHALPRNRRPDRSACASSHTCMAGAVCRTISRAFSGPAHIVTSPHRPIDRLPNTIIQKAHPRKRHRAHHSMNHVQRAASQCLKIAESCKRSSRHAQDLIIGEIPADERDKEAYHGAASASPSLLRPSPCASSCAPPSHHSLPHDRPGSQCLCLFPHSHRPIRTIETVALPLCRGSPGVLASLA